MPAGEVDGVRVDVGSGQGTYPVLVRPGLLDDLPGLLSEHAPARRYAIISDDRVASLYGEVAVERCRAQGLEADRVGPSSPTRCSPRDSVGTRRWSRWVGA